jgi:hypothetical protein
MTKDLLGIDRKDVELTEKIYKEDAAKFQRLLDIREVQEINTDVHVHIPFTISKL